MLHGDPSGIERISSEQSAPPQAQAQPLLLPPLAAAAGVANLPPGSLPPLPMSRTISSGITSAFEPWKGGGSSTSGAAARPGELLACAQSCRSSCNGSVQGVSDPVLELHALGFMVQVNYWPQEPSRLQVAGPYLSLLPPQ